jgi:precorrin-6A synthase
VRTISVVGIGSGDPEHLTVQAIAELNAADVVFMLDKGEDTRELIDVRREICDRYITGPCRIVTAADAQRDRTAANYTAAVEYWRAQRADIYLHLISSELGEDQRGAFLAWGDPAFYDSTLHVLRDVQARGTVSFGIRVIPGISSIQVLAAQHQISLTRTGRPLHITTGRRLAAEGFPVGADDVIVMLDARAAFAAAGPADEIYWGAYLGTPDEIVISGLVAEAAPRIIAARDAARARHGWIMDTYLLRRAGDGVTASGDDGSGERAGEGSSG